MLDVIKKASELFLNKIPFVIVTIIDKQGSSPREVGASMIVTEKGLICGTTGGGKEEYLAIEKAKELIKEKRSDIEKYVLTTKDAVGIGMTCGGINEMHFEYVDPEDVLAGEYFSILLDNKYEDKYICYNVGENSGFSIEVDGVMKPCTRSKKVLDNYFKLRISHSKRIFIFGGGHVSQALVPVLTYVGFEVIVLENRKEFLTEELFPNVKRMLIDYDNFSDLDILKSDYVIILTRGHKSDKVTLEGSLDKKASYIGVIGSKTKAKIMIDSLKGTKYEDLIEGRVYSPVGLSIGAQTPREIAISIAAQVIEKYRGEQ